MLSPRFKQCLGRLTCSLSKGVLKRRVLGIGLTKFFVVCHFGNTLTTRVTSFSKMFKTWFRLQKSIKKFREFFLFLRELHFYWLQQILTITKKKLAIGSQCVNKQSLDFPYLTNTDIFRLSLPQSDKEIW